MVNSTANVIAGRPKATGGVYGAPLGTALPTDASTALNAAFKSYGYIGDAGVVEHIGRTTNTVKAWGGDIVKVLQTDFTVTYDLTLIETLNTDVADAVFGTGNVTATPVVAGTHGNQLAIAVNSGTRDKQEFAFEIADGAAKVRIIIPNGQIINVGDVTYSDGAIASYPITIQAFPDASGNEAYLYTDDGATA